ncbi:MAG: UDP-N-acetylmuramate--L-alanine ligase, partial [Cyclobacteriaceae bacterium]|nr:UDP-N-acetylmuramate--L-alanine ligase [Cyclobacteriaceae bacterium]
IEGINSEMLLSLIKSKNKQLVSKEFILNEFQPAQGAVVATIGAGDIDKLVKPLQNKWSYEKNI